MKIGIIGLGDIAQKAYLPILTQMPNVELVLCSRTPDILTALQSKYRVSSATTDYQSLPKLGVDAVMIHAATSAHQEIANFFLSLHIPTFVDKPLTTSGAECEKLFSFAKQQSVPLYMGFNRRHLPLISPLLTGSQGQLKALRWEKHRCNLPGDIRTFIFDDFIHPLDSINLSIKADLENAMLLKQHDTSQQLSRLDLIFEANGTQFYASMNRLNGVTQEVVTADFINQRFQFESFVKGVKFQDNASSIIQLPDWTTMLASKGFEAMIEDWCQVIESGQMPAEVIDRNVASHWLAEHICQTIES
jgi:virulence factor